LFPSLDGLAGGDASPDVSVDVAGGDGASDVVSDAPKTYVEEVQSDSPYAWWRLGESDTSQAAKDEEPPGNNGAFQLPGVTLGLKGAIANDPNTAMALDGVNGAMHLPGTIFDFGGLPSFSIELWISPGAPPPADAADTLRRIVSHRSDAYVGWYMAIDEGQHVQFTRWDAGSQVASVVSPPIAQNQFTYVVVTGDGTSLVLFVNGVQVDASPEANVTDTPANNFSFGANSDLDGEFLNGTLDEPAIYTHALAPTRVLAHYQAGIGN
jgi:hypothetical protein